MDGKKNTKETATARPKIPQAKIMCLIILSLRFLLHLLLVQPFFHLRACIPTYCRACDTYGCVCTAGGTVVYGSVLAARHERARLRARRRRRLCSSYGSATGHASARSQDFRRKDSHNSAGTRRQGGRAQSFERGSCILSSILFFFLWRVLLLPTAALFSVSSFSILSPLLPNSITICACCPL